MPKFFMLEQKDRVADLNIFGDICEYAWEECGEASQMTIQRALKNLDVDEINVHINSYGGDVKEGIGIYHTLKDHKAKVTTICEGMACSIASVIFMAGDDRIMQDASVLMIHNPWMATAGNATELRKSADDLDVMTEMLKSAYMSCVSISVDDLQKLLDAESWILPADAVRMGFATAVKSDEQTEKAAASARKALCNLVKPCDIAEPMSEETFVNIMSKFI